MVARNLCMAVAQIHHVDIVHGDISSENFLIDKASLNVKAIDFDLAGFVGELKGVCGGLDFMTEERITAFYEK